MYINDFTDEESLSKGVCGYFSNVPDTPIIFPPPSRQHHHRQPTERDRIMAALRINTTLLYILVAVFLRQQWTLFIMHQSTNRDEWNILQYRDSPPRAIHSVPPISVRQDGGTLHRKLVATTFPGGQESSCNSTGDRIKHIIKSSASFLQWSSGIAALTSWEVLNVRKDSGGGKQTPRAADIKLFEDNVPAKNISGVLAEDPRMVLWNGHPVILYHNDKDHQMHLYNHKNQHDVRLTICGHTTKRTEKNWAPLLLEDENLFFLVYSIDPFVLLRYDIDAGDGVTTLLFGSLPVHRFKEPIAGTPFKEILLDSVDALQPNSINIRSFLSFAHTRSENKNMTTTEPGAGKSYSGRVYRPVPLLVHMFCHKMNTNFVANNCVFGSSIYDTWSDVKSPDHVLQSEWSRQRNVSVSYPYDLHVFEDGTRKIVRLGIVFEDCFSAYHDFEIDFDMFKAQRLKHNLLSQSAMLKATMIPRANQTSSCPTRYHNSKKVTSSLMAKPEEVTKYLKNTVWVVSHGGVSSERFRSTLLRGTKEEKTIASGTKHRPMKGVVAHYPYPVAEGPILCIYIYGSVYESILSQLRRHPDNIQKLHNDEAFPSIKTLSDLLDHPDAEPFGIQQQFMQFYHANVSYPIIYVKYDALLHLPSLQKLDGILSEMMGDNTYNLTSLFNSTYQRKSSLNNIPDASLRERFIERYKTLQKIFDSQPNIRVTMPK